MWDLEARSRWTATDAERTVLERKNSHHYIAYQCKHGTDGKGISLTPREGVMDFVWKKTGGNTLVCVGSPTEHLERPLVAHKVRAKSPMAFRCEEIKPGLCRIRYVNQLDFGGKVPSWVMNFYIVKNISLTYRIQSYFQARRGLEDYEGGDGEATAEMLLVKTKEEMHHGKGETRVEARVRAMTEKHKGLKELDEKYDWFKVLVAKVVTNKLRPAGDSKAKLCNMSAKQANIIGGALASCIAANLTAPAAVDEWILRYSAMGELEREYVWFRPMMDTIAQRLLESVSWGLKMRLYTGAGLSTMDLLSDVYMIYTYATTEQQGTALSLAIMVGLCLLIQLALVFVNLRKGSKVAMLKEMLIVLTGTAPGIHAMRVANGAERSEHAAMNAEAGLTFTRGIEMCFESCPGSVLQTYTLLLEMKGGGDFSKAALGSIFVFDVSPQKRRDEPDFYGYIPDAASSRTLIFGCMIINGALLLLVRSMSMALLAMVGGQWVLVYLVSDMGLYFAYKILRRDLWHWIPLEGAASVVESVLERLVVKVLVDFTGVIQFRGAGEMGGCFFTLNLAMVLAASFVATHVYYASLEEGEEAVMDESVAWTIVGGLSGLGVSFFSCFLLLMKRKYVSTFFSTQTGFAWVQSRFVANDADFARSRIFGANKKQWLSIRPDVKAWTMENWERWEEEKPEFFNDAFKATVDDDMIPPASLRKLNAGSSRRRSSLGDQMGGTSIKRPSMASVQPTN
ncbi:hypothetical protein TeGR_g223 [Tetraparma gracilis]|uniref:START domain-containing protein n=1 Tax=Tetraparma gracilis TaxID=2962635 RepID=A0ABQ6NAQ3_9STRA|nr:hypothetical protein TeGR_g223 [Tetraparma gracilis]